MDSTLRQFCCLPNYPDAPVEGRIIDDQFARHVAEDAIDFPINGYRSCLKFEHTVVRFINVFSACQTQNNHIADMPDSEVSMQRLGYGNASPLCCA